MSATPAPAFREGSADGPAFYRGAFELAATRDTFLDTRGWGKGTVWVNGHHLGRFWDIGPQQTLYVPAPWLRIGRNDVVLFTLDVPTTLTLAGLGGAVFTIERRLIRSPAP
jgi:beta-galactosidase